MKWIAVLLLACSAVLAQVHPPVPVVPEPLQPDTALDAELARKVDAVANRMDGAVDSPETSSADEGTPGLVQTIAQILASLALLGLLGFVSWSLLRRRRPQEGGAGPSGGLLDQLQVRALGQGRSLALVRVHDRVLAVVFAPQAVAVLAEFRDEAAAEILAESGQGRRTFEDFGQALDGFLRRVGGRGRPGEPPASGEAQS